MLVVQKFGGSSVATNERIFNVARQVVATYNQGHRVVVVLSAMGKTTNHLIEQAKSIHPNPTQRELDVLLATGEQVSCALMTMALHSLGVPAVSLTARQVSVATSSEHGNARIHHIHTHRINYELDKRHIVVVTGFQGADRHGNITTLGRGGSDTTAVATACALGADLCEIYTDVEGVYTADPNEIPTAIKLSEISYDEMLELASLGAKVLHNRSVEIAKKYNLNLVVRSSLSDAPGTVIKEKTTMEKMLITGITTDKGVAKITVAGFADTPGTAFKLFSLISSKNIGVDVIVQTQARRDGSNDISFTVASQDLKETLAVLEANKDYLGYKEIITLDSLVKLSVVGAGMISTPGIATAMFEALYDIGVNIEVITTSEIKISVLIDADMAKVAAASVHERLIERNMNLFH